MKNKRGKNLTVSQLEELEFLYRNNASIGEIAEHFYKNLSTIHRAINSLKIKRKTFKDLLIEYKNRGEHYECTTSYEARPRSKHLEENSEHLSKIGHSENYKEHIYKSCEPNCPCQQNGLG